MLAGLFETARTNKEGEQPAKLSLGNISQRIGADLKQGDRGSAATDLDLYVEMSAGQPAYMIGVDEALSALSTDIINGDCTVRKEDLQIILEDGKPHYIVTPRDKTGEDLPLQFYVAVNHDQNTCTVFLVPEGIARDFLRLPREDEDITYSHSRPMEYGTMPDASGVIAARLAVLSHTKN